MQSEWKDGSALLLRLSHLLTAVLVLLGHDEDFGILALSVVMIRSVEQSSICKEMIYV